MSHGVQLSGNEMLNRKVLSLVAYERVCNVWSNAHVAN